MNRILLSLVGFLGVYAFAPEWGLVAGQELEVGNFSFDGATWKVLFATVGAAVPMLLEKYLPGFAAYLKTDEGKGLISNLTRLVYRDAELREDTKVTKALDTLNTAVYEAQKRKIVEGKE